MYLQRFLHTLAWHAFLKGKNCRLSVYSSTSDLINDQNGGLGIDFPAVIQSVLIILLLFLSYSRPCIGFNNLYSLQFEVDDIIDPYRR